MSLELHRFTLTALLALVSMATAIPAHAQDPGPVRVCASLSDLGALAREIGGEHVVVSTFGVGPENPHFLEAKPTFVTALSKAEIYLQNGMELEVGYSPVLMRTARNGLVMQGARGYVDASTVIEPKGLHSGDIDRSMGDVHAGGNPHYLLDPLNGLRVAALIRDTLADVRPDWKDYFEQRFDDFRRRLGAAMVGQQLADKYAFEKLALLAEHGKLRDFLTSQGEEKLLGGWLGRMHPHHGTTYADEHDLWLYFAERFGLRNIGHMEPIPGVPPTTKQLGIMVNKMKAEKVGLIISVPYYDTKPAQFLAKKTGAKVVVLAHQVNAIKGTGDYISMLDANISRLVEALGGAQ